MAFDRTNFDANSSGSKGGMALHTYTTTVDNIATVTGSGYFDAADVLKSNDLIFSQCSDGFRLLQATVTAGVVTTAVADDGTNPLQF